MCTAQPPGHAADGLMPVHKLEYILKNRNNGSSSSDCTASPPVAFVGIGKTGSLFVQTSLELFAHEQLLPTLQPTVQPCAVGARMGWHHASADLWRRAYGAETWSKAFTFGLVRDPWARLVSHWAFHIGSKNPLDGGHMTSEQRAVARFNESHSIAHFRSWIRHARQAHPPHAPDAWKFTTGDAHGNEQARSFNASQTSWLVDGAGRLAVSAVYKLEELEQRWPELQARVCGLRGVPYATARDDPRVRAMDHPSKHAPFATYYDAETRAIVGEYMEADVRRFGYRPPPISMALA